MGTSGRQGQALTVGALMMLVLAVGVIATLSIGQAIHDRVRLQGAADAAAYSLAALEARTFNDYAFTNRAQVSHYVSAMAWQSFDSFLFGTEAFLTDAVGLMMTIDQCGNNAAVKAACDAASAGFPPLGELLELIHATVRTLKIAVRAYQVALDGSDVDRLIGRVLIPREQRLNQALAEGAQSMLAKLLGELAGGDSRQLAAGVIADIDPAARLDGQPSFSALNRCLLAHAHLKESGVHPDAWQVPGPLDGSTQALRDGAKVARAKRAMAEIANATRFACDRPGDEPSPDCPANFLTRRDFKSTLGALRPLGVPLPMQLLGTMVGTQKFGHTRLLSTNFARATKPVRIRRGGCPEYPPPDSFHDVANNLRSWRDLPNTPIAVLAQGDSLGADDLYSLGLGPYRLAGLLNPFSCGPNDDWRVCWGNQRAGDGAPVDLGFMMKASVWALNPQDRVDHGVGASSPNGGASVHWRVIRNHALGPGDVDDAALGLVQRLRCPSACGGGCVEVPRWVADVRPDPEDRNHVWQGITAFPQFEPGQFAQRCEPDAEGSATFAADRATEFNQPSAWIYLRQPAGSTSDGWSPTLVTPSGVLRYGYSGAGGRLDLRGKVRPGAGLAEGLNVVARALTYYHRPGNWAEQPNFFNPYWRARLAPIEPAASSESEVHAWLEGLPQGLARIPQKVMTH